MSVGDGQSDGESEAQKYDRSRAAGAADAGVSKSSNAAAKDVKTAHADERRKKLNAAKRTLQVSLFSR